MERRFGGDMCRLRTMFALTTTCLAEWARPTFNHRAEPITMRPELSFWPLGLSLFSRRATVAHGKFLSFVLRAAFCQAN